MTGLNFTKAVLDCGCLVIGGLCQKCCDHGHVCKIDHYCTDCGKDMREEVIARVTAQIEAMEDR